MPPFGKAKCVTTYWLTLPPQVAVVTARVALRATTGVDVDLSDFLRAVRDETIEEVAERILDEDALLRVVSGDEMVGADMQRITKASYEALQKFMDKEVARHHDDEGYIDFKSKMQRESDGKGGLVWVRTENVQRWKDSLSTSAARSR